MSLQVTGYSVWAEDNHYTNESFHIQDFSSIEDALAFIATQSEYKYYQLQVDYEEIQDERT